MPLVVLNEGKLVMLAWLLKRDDLADVDMKLRLFQNDFQPDKGTVRDEFEECDFDGYAEKDLTRATWTAPVTVEDKAKTFYGASAQTWEVTGPTGNTVYGYYVTDEESGKALWAQRFAAPRVLVQFDSLDVYPEFTFDSEYNP